MRRRAAAQLYQTSRSSIEVFGPSNLQSRPSTRRLHIQPAPTSTYTNPPPLSISSTPSRTAATSPSAAFETVGPNSSLLHISLNASTTLCARRGTLASFHGDPESALSTLSVLSPILRAPLGIPFLYQRISATAPSTILLSSFNPNTSYTVLALDGRTDWLVTNRTGLAAWAGDSLRVTAKVRTSLGLAHWGQTHLTGRGLVALTSRGAIFQISIAAGEHYVARPGHVLAYSQTSSEPMPYRFKSFSRGGLINAPSLGSWAPDIAFFRNMRQTRWYQLISKALLRIRTWTRRTIFGDRLFLKFQGPCTILLQSGGSRVREVLSGMQIDEIADAPAGKAIEAIQVRRRAEQSGRSSSEAGLRGTEYSGNAGKEWSLARSSTATKLSYASVRNDGTVEFEK